MTSEINPTNNTLVLDVIKKDINDSTIMPRVSAFILLSNDIADVGKTSNISSLPNSIVGSLDQNGVVIIIYIQNYYSTFYWYY